jgi:hypothetical protein
MVCPRSQLVCALIGATCSLSAQSCTVNMRPPEFQPKKDRASARLVALCVPNKTFGCFPGEALMWVSHGCRATFECDGARTGICGLRGDTAEVRNCSCSRNQTERVLLNRAAAIARSPAAALLPAPTAARVRELVSQQLGVPSSCVPDGAVMLSIVNEHHLPLHRLAFAHMLGRREQCLVDRLVSLCFGHDESPGRCIRLPSAPPSDHRQGQYHQLVWLKYHLLRLALGVDSCTAALFTDADVAYFASPFTWWPARVHPTAFDLVFPGMPRSSSTLRGGNRATRMRDSAVSLGRKQGNLGTAAARASTTATKAIGGTTAAKTSPPGGWASCDAGGALAWDLNGGILLFTSAALLDVILASEPTEMRPAMPLDQDTVIEVLRKPHALKAFTTCTWPNASHIEHCVLEHRLGLVGGYPPSAREMTTWQRRTLFRPPAHSVDEFVCGLISYHATCRSDVEGKAAALRMIISERASAQCNQTRRIG